MCSSPAAGERRGEPTPSPSDARIDPAIITTISDEAGHDHDILSCGSADPHADQPLLAAYVGWARAVSLDAAVARWVHLRRAHEASWVAEMSCVATAYKARDIEPFPPLQAYLDKWVRWMDKDEAKRTLWNRPDVSGVKTGLGATCQVAHVLRSAERRFADALVHAGGRKLTWKALKAVPALRAAEAGIRATYHLRCEAYLAALLPPSQEEEEEE